MDGRPPPTLRRILGLPVLVLYGLGTIVGAGIYVVVGEVAARSGDLAPLAFLAAGLCASFTALSYAELVGRHPEAAGTGAFVGEAFGRAAGRLAGIGMLAMAVLTGAALARGGLAYLTQLIGLPPALLAAFAVGAFTAIACLGIRESAVGAVLFTIVELLGLVYVVAVGAGTIAVQGPVGLAGTADPGGPAALALLSGASIAFFAFAGFEVLANLAEESRDVERQLPRAILLSLAIATVLYLAVVGVAVLAAGAERLAASPVPLCEVVDCAASPRGEAFVAVAVVATFNGILVEIVLAGRLAYGMARRGWVPAWLGAVHARRRTPVRATLLAGAAMLGLAVAVPFAGLASLTSLVLLALFAAANAALVRLHRRSPLSRPAIRAPRWVPVAGLATSLLLFAAELLR